MQLADKYWKPSWLRANLQRMHSRYFYICYCFKPSVYSRQENKCLRHDDHFAQDIWLVRIQQIWVAEFTTYAVCGKLDILFSLRVRFVFCVLIPVIYYSVLALWYWSYLFLHSMYRIWSVLLYLCKTLIRSWKELQSPFSITRHENADTHLCFLFYETCRTKVIISFFRTCGQASLHILPSNRPSVHVYTPEAERSISGHFTLTHRSPCQRPLSSHSILAMRLLVTTIIHLQMRVVYYI